MSCRNTSTRRKPSSQLDFRELRSRLVPHIEDLVRSLLPDGRREGSEWVTRNPNRSDRRPGSFKVNMGTGMWADFALEDKASRGDIISLFSYIGRTTYLNAAKRLSNLVGGSHGR